MASALLHILAVLKDYGVFQFAMGVGLGLGWMAPDGTSERGE